MRKPSIEIKKTHHCLRRYIEAEVDKVIGGDLTGIQGVVIDYIYYKSIEKGESIYQRDIEERFSVRRSTATIMLQALEKKGYITKESVQHDARLKKLILTEKAIKMHESLDPIVEEFERSLSEGISEEDMAIFLRVLEQIRNNIKKKG